MATRDANISANAQAASAVTQERKRASANQVRSMALTKRRYCLVAAPQRLEQRPNVVRLGSHARWRTPHDDEMTRVSVTGLCHLCRHALYSLTINGSLPFACVMNQISHLEDEGRMKQDLDTRKHTPSAPGDSQMPLAAHHWPKAHGMSTHTKHMLYLSRSQQDYNKAVNPAADRHPSTSQMKQQQQQQQQQSEKRDDRLVKKA
ncbi:hypothetical protein CCMA1212_010317 [Trichoderma ghanense]|uniref:Uncharacterized protein n=1 Tax=Trichoderma ghanense TaxID=65468 RepID=A0ABY2GRL1_9HYPO